MADIRANKLNNGTDIAWFMNAIKVDEDAITLYNTENELMNSIIGLEELSEYLSDYMDTSSSGDPRTEVYYADNYISAIQADSNCTVQFNSLIERVYNAGGGTIILDSREYKVSALYLLSNVHIVGAGKGNTIISRISGTQTGTIQDGDSSGYGFINIPEYSTNCELRDLTIYGNCNHAIDSTDGFDYITAGDSQILHGVLFEDASGEYSLSGTNKANDNDSLFSKTTTPMDGESRVVKHCILDKIAVIGFSGHGIYIGSNISDINIIDSIIRSNCLMGIKNAGVRNIISNSRIHGNGSNGLVLTGKNNIITGCSVDLNGFSNHSSYAILVSGKYNQLSNVSCKFNWCGGIECSADSNVFSAVVLDSNGARSRSASEGKNLAPNDCAQFALVGAIKNRIDIALLHSRTGSVSPRIGFESTNNARYNIIDVIQDPNSAGNISTINGTQIENNITNDTIGDNIVRYLKS